VLFGRLTWHCRADGERNALFMNSIALVAVSGIIAVGLLVISAIKSGRPLLFSTPQLWLLGIVYICWAGGSIAIMSANAGVDRSLHSTYYVISHLHSIISMVSLFTVFYVWYQFFPKVTRYRYSQRLGRIHFWMTFIGINFLFLPQHYLGLVGMPRKYADYPDVFTFWNKVSLFGSYLLAGATVFFVVTMLHAYFIARERVD
jgi:cytochrome c oxidase subunit I